LTNLSIFNKDGTGFKDISGVAKYRTTLVDNSIPGKAER
jgi:hypothetical protein